MECATQNFRRVRTRILSKGIPIRLASNLSPVSGLRGFSSSFPPHSFTAFYVLRQTCLSDALSNIIVARVAHFDAVLGGEFVGCERTDVVHLIVIDLRSYECITTSTAGYECSATMLPIVERV